MLTISQYIAQRANPELTVEAQLSVQALADAAQEIAKGAWAYQQHAGETLSEWDDTLLTELLRECMPSSLPSGDSDKQAGWLISRAIHRGCLVETEAAKLSAQGESFQAFPKLCEHAYASFMQWGPDHPYTVRSVFIVHGRQESGRAWRDAPTLQHVAAATCC